MTIKEAIAIMGPSATSDRERLRARYRRLAFLHHPDRNAGDAASFARFKRVGSAYRLLDALMQAEPGWEGRTCSRCKVRPARRHGLDRNAYCRECLVYEGGQHMLPAAPTIIASCALAAVAQAASVIALVAFVATSRAAFGLIALTAAVGGLVALATSAVQIGEVASRRRRRRTA